MLLNEAEFDLLTSSCSLNQQIMSLKITSQNMCSIRKLLTIGETPRLLIENLPIIFASYTFCYPNYSYVNQTLSPILFLLLFSTLN